MRIHFFREFEVWQNDVRMDADFSRQNKELLKILILNRGQVVPNEVLIEYIWPDKPPDQGLRFLRARVHELRKALHPDAKATDHPFVETQPGGYRFSLECQCTIDIEEFRALIEKGERAFEEGDFASAITGLNEAKAIYRGPFLPEDLLAEWAQDQIDRMSDLYAQLHSRLAEALAHLGYYQQAIQNCKEALRLKPGEEENYRRAMIYLHQIGNKSEAIQIYESCRSFFRSQYETSPSADTEMLYQQILDGFIPGIDSKYPKPSVASNPIPISLQKPPFTGRDHEYARLIQHLEEARAGRGGLVLINGELGVGKSRLMQELAVYGHEELGVDSLWGYCTQIGSSSSFQCFNEPLSELLSESEASYPVLERWFGRSLSSQEKKLDHSLSPDQRRYQLFLEISELLLDAAKERKFLVLMLEDLHWGDPSSIELLDFLMTKIADQAIVIIGSYRGDEITNDHVLSNLLVRVRRELPWNNISLSRFSKEDLKLMVDRIAPELESLNRLSQYLFDESDGTPLFIVALLQALFDRSLLRIEDGKWTADVDRIVEIDRAEFPIQVHELIRTRLDQLTEMELKLAQLISVIGQRTDQELLRAIWISYCDRSGILATENLSAEVQLIEILKSLLESHLLVNETSQYLFSHSKIQSVVYESILLTERQYMHRIIANELVAISEQGSEVSIGVIGHHFERAGKPVQALECYMSALDECVDEYRNEEGLSFAKRAWMISSQNQHLRIDGLSAVEIQYKIKKAEVGILNLLGRRDQQYRSLKNLAALAAETGNYRNISDVYLMQTEYFLAVAEYDQAHLEALKIRKIARIENDWSLERQAVHLIAKTHYKAGRYEEAYNYWQEEVELLSEIGDQAALSETQHYLALVLFRRGLYAEAATYFELALNYVDEAEELERKAKILLDQGMMYWTQGKHQQAIALYREASSIAADIGDLRAEAHSVSSLGVSYLSLGHYEKALVEARRAAHLHEQIGSKRALALDLNQLGILFKAFGLEETAIDYFGRAEKLFSETENDDGLAMVWNNRSLILANQGHLNEALELSLRSIEAAKRSGYQYALASLYRSATDIAVQMNKPDLAKEFADQALVIAKALGSKTDELLTYSDFSRVYISAENTKKAIKYAEASLELFEIDEHAKHAPRVYFACFNSHYAAGLEEQAIEYLELAYSELCSSAEYISDASFRQSYLEKVPLHRKILTAYRQHVSQLSYSDAECYEILRETRWPDDKVICPFCSHDETQHYGFIKEKFEKRYLCKACDRTFSDRTKTPFAHSNLSLSKLFRALELTSQLDPNSSDPRPIQDALNLNRKTAARVRDKMSSALSEDELAQRLAKRLNDHPGNLNQ